MQVVSSCNLKWNCHVFLHYLFLNYLDHKETSVIFMQESLPIRSGSIKPAFPCSQFFCSPQSDSSWKQVAALFLMPQVLKPKYKHLISPYQMKTNWKLLSLILTINKVRLDKTGKETVWLFKTSEITCTGLSHRGWKIFWHLEPLTLVLVLAMSSCWTFEARVFGKKIYQQDGRGLSDIFSCDIYYVWIWDISMTHLEKSLNFNWIKL